MAKVNLEAAYEHLRFLGLIHAQIAVLRALHAKGILAAHEAEAALDAYIDGATRDILLEPLMDDVFGDLLKSDDAEAQQIVEDAKEHLMTTYLLPLKAIKSGVRLVGPGENENAVFEELRDELLGKRPK